MIPPREMPCGSRLFVFARPKSRDWSEIDGSTVPQGREEFRACMILGHDEGQRLFMIGSKYGYQPEAFEIGEDVPAPAHAG
jgi:hypothetical protein